jgi:hypothetical protein
MFYLKNSLVMKNKIVLVSILAAMVIAISCTTSKNIIDAENQNKVNMVILTKVVSNSGIEGVWKLVYSDLLTENLPENVIQYKVIADGRFFWYKFNDEERMIYLSDGAGGTYSLDGNSYTEHVEHVLPEMSTYQGMDYVTTFDISGNILKTEGSIFPIECGFKEVYERVSTADKNFAEIAGAWKQLNSNFVPVHKSITRYKLIVDNWFLFYDVDNGGMVSQINAGGNLEKNDSTYAEITDHYSAVNDEWDGTYHYKCTISKFQSQKDVMKLQGERNGDAYTELYEKVKKVTANNAAK